MAPLANTTELVLPLAHHIPQPKPNGKSIGSAIFTQLMTQYCWAHWRKLANTIEHVLLSAHPSPHPNGKSIGSAVSAQLRDTLQLSVQYLLIAYYLSNICAKIIKIN